MNLLRNFQKNVKNRKNEVMLHSFSCVKEEWTYGEVDELTDRIAAFIASNGVKQGDTCMLCFGDYTKLFITIIALIKVGAVLIITDPDSPHKQIEYKMRNAGCRFIMTDSGQSLNVFGVTVLNYESACEYSGTSINMEIDRADSEMFSIGYTSGTTGDPKGVYRSNAAFENSLINAEALISEYGCDSILMSANPWFALYLGLMFPMAIMSDGIVYIPDREMLVSLDEMHRVIREYNIEHCFMSPSYLLNYCDNYDKHNLKLVYTSGDKLRLKKSPGFDVMTQYGQTEAAGPIARVILKTQEDWDRLSTQTGSVLGRPILNMQAYILDNEGNLLEPTKTGQICVCGPQIGPGYVGMPELNAQKFIKTDYSDYLMLMTGDTGYMDEDGILFMTGRNSTVININGQKVDIAEVEAVIVKHDDVADCRVISAQDKHGENYLIAYCTVRREIAVNDIRKHIADAMPSYCVPRYIVVLDKFPLNSNGKVDVSKLPVPRYESDNYVAPSNDVERKIVEIIAELIGADVDRIGACDCFDDLGMDSLMFSMLVIRLEDEFGIELTYKQLIESSNIRTLAMQIQSKENQQGYNNFDFAVEKKQIVSGPPLSILLECMLRDHDDTAYNSIILIPFNKKPDIDRLNAAIERLIASQEMLHSVFTYDGKNIYRELRDDVDFSLEVINVDSNKWNEVRSDLAAPFELFGELLYRIRLYRIVSQSDEKYYLMFECHHSISDQHSFNIFYSELFRLYESNQESGINNYLTFNQVDSENEKYWDDYYEKITSQADVIADVHNKKNEKTRNAAVRTKSFKCAKELQEKLEKFCSLTGFTKANVLMTSYQILISNYCQNDGFPVAVPFRGRTRAADRNTIGMFVRVLPVVYTNTGTIREILLENRKTLSDHQQHQISDVFFRKDKNFQEFVFNFINLKEPEKYEVVEGKNVRFKQIFYYYSCPDNEDEIRVEYDTSAFTSEAIARFYTYFNRVLNEVIDHTDVSPDKIELLSIDERTAFANGYTGENILVDGGTYYEHFVRCVKDNRNRTALIYSSASGEIRVTYGELLDKAESMAAALSDNYHIIDGKNSLDTIEECFSSLAAGIPFIYMNSEMPEEYRKDITARLIDADNNNAVFYLCTSGTTGKSKIIRIDNKGLLNECCGENAFYNTNKKSVVAVTSSPTFDMFYLTALPVLLTGGTLILLSEEFRKNISKMEKCFKKYCVDRTFMTTRLAEQYMMLVEDSQLKVLLTAGETLNKVVKRNYKLVNGYGPAEVGFITRETIDFDEEDISIGFPANNRIIYIIDKNNHVCPLGVPGEIVTGGPRISTGYIGASDADNERFADNVFKNDGSTLYRTGDIAYISENGKLYFVGRKDKQIKINGIKVETDAIISLALKVDGVEQVHILINGSDTRGKYPVLFYTANTDKNEQLRRILKHNLPESAIPEKYYRIDEMPLNANAKTDEAKLRELIADSADKDYEAPSTKLERELVELTAEALNLDAECIGVNTEISAIGCDSLSAMAMSYRIEEKYGISINPVDFMRYITLKDIAEKINDDRRTGGSDILTSYYEVDDISSVPMVFVHTGNTGSEAYLPLAAKLNPGTRFYCIENYNVLHNESRIRGINNLAKMYCGLIEKIPNNGTFILGGWSYGGIIAHSMAAMMEAKGYKVKLILLDSICITSEVERRFYKKLNMEGQSQEYLKQSPLFEKYREMGLIDVLYENNRYVIQDILDYEPMNCQSTACLFKAMESDMDKTSAIDDAKERAIYREMVNSKTDNGFGRNTGDMEIVPIYTDHDYFMKGEALEIIAEKINDIYEEMNE